MKTEIELTANHKPDTEKLLRVYTQLVRLRAFEERVKEIYAATLMPGLAHLYIGEEAVAVGVCEALRDDDYITSTHRGHGHLLAKGGDTNLMMAEIMGRESGYCKGKGGSMHIAGLSLGIIGANGIVGAGIPIAAGAGLQVQLSGSDSVVACFFGDSASNQGMFHEGINLASLWHLPVVFICENNLYGISVRQDRHQNITNISDRAVAYGIPGETVDGTDVFAVHEAAERAVSRARAGEGPSLIECKCYRWLGHHAGDPAHYRPPGELESWKERCPVKLCRERLMADGILSEEENNRIVEAVYAEMMKAQEWASAQPFPKPESALEDVYA
ncbi:MAG: thiamine pyrophosphate-dependent dehydrogenase E1 component subunit alpha [Armatimonadetes bacterium]|nr:thiamine pyrophosphate-dependent dehydrogenase E1 component subunit alpha [Armatimonadota bacterium]